MPRSLRFETTFAHAEKTYVSPAAAECQATRLRGFTPVVAALAEYLPKE